MTSETTKSVLIESKSRSNLFPSNCSIPIVVAFTIAATSLGMTKFGVQWRNSACAEVRVLMVSTKSSPRSIFRFTTIIFFALTSASSIAIARAAPPAPKIQMVFPSGLRT